LLFSLLPLLGFLIRRTLLKDILVNHKTKENYCPHVSESDLITYNSFSIPIKKGEEDKKGRKQIGNNETNENEDEGADHDANAVSQGKEFRVGRRVLQNFYQSVMNHLYEWAEIKI
jgi:hypothetical protein